MPCQRFASAGDPVRAIVPIRGRTAKYGCRTGQGEDHPERVADEGAEFETKGRPKTAVQTTAGGLEIDSAGQSRESDSDSERRQEE